MMYVLRTVCLVLILSCYLPSCAFAQDEDKEKITGTQDSIDYSFHKIIPPSIRRVALDVLTYYPELQESYIEFVLDPDIVNVFMQAQPKFLTLFNYKKDRKYRIQMLPYMLVGDEEIPVSQLPEDVLRGWFAHELGHIVDYHNRSGINLLWFGVRYTLFPNFVVNAERRADIIAIQHGLGEEISITKDFILNESDLSPSYKNKIRHLYMSPQEVLELLKEVEEESESRE